MKRYLPIFYLAICSLTIVFSSCSNDEEKTSIIEKEDITKVTTPDGFTNPDISITLPETTFGNEVDCIIREDDQFNALFLLLINEYREKKGLNKLASNTIADYLAFKHTKHMVCNDQFDQINFDETSEILKTTVKSTSVTENIITGYTSPRQMVSTWLSNPEYKENIANPTFTHTGFSAIRTSNGLYCATQNFYR